MHKNRKEQYKYMDSDLSVLLKVILDSSGIGSGDISKIQKILEKYTVNVTAEIDKAQLINSVKQVLPQVLKEINKISGTNIKIDIDDSLIEKSIDQVIQDGKRLEKELTSTAQRINKIQLSMDNGHGASEYQNRINAVTASLEKYGVGAEEAKKITASLQSTFDSMKGMSGQELVNQANKLEQEFKAVKASVEQAKIAYNKYMQPVSNEKATSLINRINTFLSKNTRITNDAKIALQGYVDELGRGVNLSRWNEINGKLKETENSMRGLHRLGASLKNQMSQAAQSFTQWLSVSSGIMFLISKTKDAISEIKELNNTLTEISKTSDLTDKQLKQLGMDSYDSASKYGRAANDYLTGVQEMNRSGFYGKKGTSMAEQSLLAQSAGDMDRELADRYILATNAAYKLNGEAEKINAVLDGMNSITNRNSVAMADMAAAMTKAGTVASSYRVKVEDLSAIIGTIESVTKIGGDEVGNAIKAILINLQNITSSKIVDTLDKANASMTETVNGTKKLREPIDILRDLAKTFNQLDEDDPLRAEILTNIGQKYHAQKLGALLQNMDMYDKMLSDYADGEGSAFEEASKSANNLEGTLNKTYNSWVKFINGIINSDGLITCVDLLNNVVKGLESITNYVGILTTANGNLSGIGGTIGAISGFIMNRNGNGECIIFLW